MATPTPMVVSTIKMQKVSVRLKSTTGLYCHKMGAKAKKNLLLGGGKKTAAEKKKLKHEVFDEFRESMCIDEKASHHTSIFMPATAIKGAMAQAALETEGAKNIAIISHVSSPLLKVCRGARDPATREPNLDLPRHAYPRPGFPSLDSLALTIRSATRPS